MVGGSCLCGSVKFEFDQTGVVMGIMITPMIASLAEDGVTDVPASGREHLLGDRVQLGDVLAEQAAFPVAEEDLPEPRLDLGYQAGRLSQRRRGLSGGRGRRGLDPGFGAEAGGRG